MAYAALSSVLQTLNQIPQPAEEPFASLQQKVSSILLILEKSSQENSVPIDVHLEGRIRDASYQVEYMVESHISTQALVSQSEVSSWVVDQNTDIVLQERIDEFKSLEETLSEMDFSSGQSKTSVDSRRIQSTVVGRDMDLMRMMDFLTGHQSRLDGISIVGMGGIGKTTLARHVYSHPLIEQHYDIRAWVIISQEYDVRKVLTSLLDFTTPRGGRLSIEELKLMLYQRLKNRRYIVVMDDVWDTGFLDQVRPYFPDDSNGSRIILTSRLSEIAIYFDRNIHKISLLTEEESWYLLLQKVFGEGSCPFEFERIGREMTKYCTGFPLLIVLIGGILSKGKATREYWEYVADNLKCVITRHDDLLIPILLLSYKLLPHHLKPCFLYMGVFPEDHEIYVSNLIKIWIAEGFVRPRPHKSLEEEAEDYLNDLIDRNLITLHKTNHSGRMKACISHDLLMDLCWKIAHDEKFFQVLQRDTQVSREGKNNELRLSIRSDTLAHLVDVHESSVHTLLYFCTSFPNNRFISITLSCTMLRVLDALTIRFYEFPIDIVELVYLRYLALLFGGNMITFPESISKLRDLQTLIVCQEDTATLMGNLTCVYLPSNIWEMPQLRHLLLERSFLPPKLVGKHSGAILENLQTLLGMINFRCSREVVEMMPNLKKLEISYLYDVDTVWSSYEFNNFVHLHQLEKLKCHFVSESVEACAVNLTFPPNLRILSIRGGGIPWEKMRAVGSLTKLEVLKLKDDAFEGPIWEVNEGEFSRLKYLVIEHSNLEQWEVEDTHFPNLEHLSLRYCPKLKEIPSGVGDIPTLDMLEVSGCSRSAAESARKIQEEQAELGNDSLTVRINRFIGDY